jgi:hypothetical protein
LSRKTTIVLVIAVALIAIKLVLAATTPASQPVVYYLQVQSFKRSPDAANPWGRFNNVTLALWYALPIDHPDLEGFLSNNSLLLPTPFLILLLLVKLPLVAADVLVAYVVFLLTKKIWPLSNRPIVASLLWLANPYSTFVTEMLGAIDILPVACIMVGLFLVMRKNHLLGAFSFAIGIFLKLFPIVAIPAVLYSSLIAGCHKVKVVLSTIIALVAVGLYVQWSDFPYSSAYYTLSTVEFILGTQSPFGLGNAVQFIGLATFSVVITYLLIYEFRPGLFDEPWIPVLISLLAYLAFLDFQPENMLWVVPLLTIAIFKEKRLIPVFALFLGSAFLLAFFNADGFTTVSGWTLLFFNRTSPWADNLLGNQLIDLVLRPLLRSLLAAFTILSIIYLATSGGTSLES